MLSWFVASNPVYDAYIDSDPLGKLIFIALALLSCLSWAVIIYKVRLLRMVEAVNNQIFTLWGQTTAHPLNLVLPPSKIEKLASPPFSEIYETFKRHALAMLNKNKVFNERENQVFLSPEDISFIDTYVYSTISAQVKQLEKHLFLLPIIMSLAPFLGLLGTVWGILLTFGELHQHGGGASHEIMLGGLAMALGTTVLGLVVAIPALVAHGFLRTKIRYCEHEMENFAQQLLAAIELHYRRVDR